MDWRVEGNSVGEKEVGSGCPGAEGKRKEGWAMRGLQAQTSGGAPIVSPRALQ